MYMKQAQRQRQIFLLQGPLYLISKLDDEGLISWTQWRWDINVIGKMYVKKYRKGDVYTSFSLQSENFFSALSYIKMLSITLMVWNNDNDFWIFICWKVTKIQENMFVFGCFLSTNRCQFSAKLIKLNSHIQMSPVQPLDRNMMYSKCG